jgi:predicted enzyme related to lactoylglutathione lyase
MTGPSGSEQAPEAVGRLVFVTIDCADPEALARFWGAVLGCEVSRRWGPYVIFDRVPNAAGLVLQRVEEPKRGKNRLHLDIRVRDVEAANARIVALGGRVLNDVSDEGFNWRVVADPEGNEFCLLPGRSAPTS